MTYGIQIHNSNVHIFRTMKGIPIVFMGNRMYRQRMVWVCNVYELYTIIIISMPPQQILYGVKSCDINIISTI